MSGSKVLPFNPLDKQHLGESVAQALLRQQARRLSDLKKFIGAGIYVLYYVGDFPAYSVISRANGDDKFLAPIYVGRAIPKGGRKGASLSVTSTGQQLFSRLSKHASSIEQVSNLDCKDFFFRALVVDDIWIPLGEALLIAKFAPIWNQLIDGFGNHDPGSGRYGGLRPRWDVLHPGRPWAAKCKQRDESAAQIAFEAEEWLRSNPPPTDVDILAI